MGKRQIGALGLTGILYFTVSGGPYGLEPLLGSVGPLVGVALICAVPLLWCLPTVLMVAELSAALPFEGGYYRWVDRALGRFWAFQEVWWSWASSLADMAIYPVLFAGYLAASIQAGASCRDCAAAMHVSPLAQWMMALAMIWVSAGLNLLGIRPVGNVAVISGAFIFLPFLVFSGAGFFSTAPIQWNLPGNGTGILVGLSVVLWNYTGWDNISLVGEEVDSPERSYPRALAAGLLLIPIFYLLPVTAGLHVAPQPESWKEGAFPNLALLLPGSPLFTTWLSRWLLAGAVISTFTLFNSLLLSYSRLPMALAMDRMLPERLARVDARGVPAASILTSAAIYSLFALLGFSKLVVLYVVLYTLSMVLEFLALWRLRIQEPDLPRPFRIPGGSLGMALTVVPPFAIAVVVMIFTLRQGRDSWGWLVLSLAGVPLYWLLRPKS